MFIDSDLANRKKYIQDMYIKNISRYVYSNGHFVGESRPCDSIRPAKSEIYIELQSLLHHCTRTSCKEPL